MKNDICAEMKLDRSDYPRLKQLLQNTSKEGFRIMQNLSQGTQCMPFKRESLMKSLYGSKRIQEFQVIFRW